MTLPTGPCGDCARAWEAMPWVLQESASPKQAEWLADHLERCESCRAEFAQQSRLRLAMSLPTDVPLDANAGLKRLLARLDMPPQEAVPERARSGTWLTRALVAAVLVQALGIGALGMRLWSENAVPAYRTLSEATPPAAAGAIHVVPDASMTLAEWDALLHALQLQVVGGPNDVGAYTVVPKDDAATGSKPAELQTLQRLRATRGIRLAEPVAGTP